MSTIIRHSKTKRGFIVVVTDFESGFTARFQEYEMLTGYTHPVLVSQVSFSEEVNAIKIFNNYES